MSYLPMPEGYREPGEESPPTAEDFKAHLSWELEFLTGTDYAAAIDMTEELGFRQALAFLRGWAYDYSLTAELETREAEENEDR